jgi:glycosyltransferase XagB
MDRGFGGTPTTNVSILKRSGAYIKSKFADSEVALFSDALQSEKGCGFHYKGKEYVPHSRLSSHKSALYSLSGKQKKYLIIGVLLLLVLFLINWHVTLIAVISFLTILYFLDLLFSFFLITKGFTSSPEWKIKEEEVNALQDENLPTYTIFCPLYKEKEVLTQFVSAMEALDYPKDKLQIMLLLEADDALTVNAAYNMNLADHFEIVVVPHSFPKTKPKACNYGLLYARGKYCVIYDAEDMPERDQLKKVVIAFSKSKERVGCIQAKLNFYNPDQNLLTRLFTSEYSLWFELVLTGLQSINAPIPLGGTSNHFETGLLRSLHGWDAFNVTEDCDLGMRLAKGGYETALIDSTTFEEANCQTKNWFNQRTRWIKGYIQTYFVHSRDLAPFIKSKNKIHFPAFQIIVGGKILSMYINPLMWTITITYFVFRSTAGDFIESLYLWPVFYMGVFSFVFGNFVYFYNYMIGCAKRGKYELIKYSFFIPFYWLMMSGAAWVALYRLIKSPHHWSKTVHGLHLKKPVENVQEHSVTSGILQPEPATY